MLGATELGLILVIVLILFGAGRLPQVFEAFGKGIKSFRDAQRDVPDELKEAAKLINESPLRDADVVSAKETVIREDQRS